jgi:hypothetical protein
VISEADEDGVKSADKETVAEVQVEEREDKDEGNEAEEEEVPEDSERVIDMKHTPLVNRRIRKWFPDQASFYEGTLTKPFVLNGGVEYSVEYDDGVGCVCVRTNLMTVTLGRSQSGGSK